MTTEEKLDTRSNLVDTDRKVAIRRKRRSKNRKKSAKGYEVELPSPHVDGGRIEIGSKNISKLANSISGRDQALTEIQHTSPIIWVMRNISTERGEPMSFVDRPYLIDIYKDFSEHVIVKKGAQIGLTQLSVAKSLYIADIQPMTIIYTFPTDKDVGDFSKTRFGTIIHDSPYLRARIKSTDSVGIKTIGNSTIFFRGTHAERQGISIPSDLNIHDELDFSNPDVRDVFSKRLSVSKYKWEWDFSTPTVPDRGIDALWKESDKHIWVVTCTGCNKEQTIDFFIHVKRRRKRGGEKGWVFACMKCDKKLNRKNGRYVSLKPNRSIRGYFVPQTICPVISARRLMLEYKRAKKKPLGMKTFFNYNLGKAYESGENTITVSMIKDKVVSGTAEQGKIAIGVDQGDVCHVVVTKLTDRRRVIFMGTLGSIPNVVDLLNHYARNNPVVAVLDALPNHNEAERYSSKIHNLYLCYYNENGGLDRESLEAKIDKKELHVSRTDLLDQMAYSWSTGESVIENYINPHRIDEFANQMAAMKRDLVEDKIKKSLKPAWIRTGPDHYRHADAYAWLAQQLYTGRKSDKIMVGGDVIFSSSQNSLFTEEEPW